MELKEEVSVKTKRHFIKITYPIFIEYKGKSLKIGATIFEYDKDKLYKPVYEVQKIIIYIATILLALIIFITYLLSNYVTRPLLYLTESTKIISRGNLNHVISISSNDEVGILSKRFNEMTSHLKHSYEDLEEKVIQRTSELVKSQRTLTSVLENAPLILFATDIEGVVTLSEGKALHLIGIQRGQAVGIPFFDLFEDKPEAIISAKSALGGETVIITETLERFTFEVNYSPLYDINNQIAGMLATYFDITENVKSREIIQAEKEKSDKLLQNILPLKIANELKEKGYVKPTLYKSVTVIFTDFKGFTKIASNMGPEELLDKLDMIFLQFDQICERRKIEKLKTIGDAYMCAGGLPEVNTTHPLDACLAAIEMQNFMNEIKQIMEQISGEEFWDMRLGIHTGEVIAGVIGKTKFAYDVWGDAVNTASRMESNGDIGRINISDTTYSIVQEYFECVHRGKIEAKNKGMIDMYYLLRLKEKYSKDKEGTVPNDLFLQEYSKFINTNHLK
jgi:PAS domain S-box-containing protein